MTTHRNLMLLTIGLSFGLFVLLRFIRGEKLYRMILTVGILVLVFFMTLGADRGAWLVFVEGSGVKSAKHLHNH